MSQASRDRRDEIGTMTERIAIKILARDFEAFKQLMPGERDWAPTIGNGGVRRLNQLRIRR
jgi:hypothetical protein